MYKFQKIIYLLLFIPFLLYGQSDYLFIPKYKSIISLEKGNNLLNQCSRSIPENIDGFFDLSENEVNEIQNNFKKIYKLKSSGCCIKKVKIGDLNQFAFLFIGVIIKGEKFIYINAFYWDEKGNIIDINSDVWKTKPIIVCDGGTYYWGVLFDLKRKKFSQLSFNGVI